MKKRLKVITAFLLMIVMAASGTCVFAGTDVQPAGDEPQAAVEVVGEGEAPVDAVAIPEEQASFEVTEDVADMEIMSESLAAAELDEEEGAVSLMDVQDYIYKTVTAPTLTYSTTKKPGWEEMPYGTLIKVNVKTSGKLWIDAKSSENNTSGATVFVSKYDPKAADVEFSYSNAAFIDKGKKENAIGGLDVVSGGSYCIGIKSSEYGNISVRPYVYSYATRSLPAGKWMLTEGYKTTSDGTLKDPCVCFKIKPAKTGYIRVFLKEYGNNTSDGDVLLLNSKKKAVSDKEWFYTGSNSTYVSFGVKKGTTYYLKVYNARSFDAPYHYGIKYKIYAAKLRANTSKKKATTLKRKAKYISTAMPATGKSGSQWYKFKVTKKRTTQVNIDTKNIKSGKITVTAYRGKKKIDSITLYNGQVNPIKITYTTTYDGKAMKGTYYIKITKSAKANGAYKVRYAK